MKKMRHSYTMQKALLELSSAPGVARAGGYTFKAQPS